MGLDMYATRRIYAREAEAKEMEKNASVVVTRSGKPAFGLNLERIDSVWEEIMRWRKANHIHGWFVENVQDGRDDCGLHRVYEGHLRKLLDVCERVAESAELVDGTIHPLHVYDSSIPGGQVMDRPGKVLKEPRVAMELLPRRDGFFFGSQEYDEDYLQDVIETRDWAYRTIEDIKRGVPGEIYYSSSW